MKRRPSSDWTDDDFRELFQALPEFAPAAGFAQRTAARLEALRRRRRLLRRTGHTMIAALLTLTGLGLPLVLQTVGRFAHPGLLAELFGPTVRAGLALLDGVVHLLDFWQSLSGLRNAAWLIATSPPILIGSFLFTAFVALAWRALTELIFRNPHHALA